MPEQALSIERDRIRAVLEDVWGAIRDKDADAAVQHYAPDFVSFSMAPPLATSGADPKPLEDWFASWQGPIGFEPRDVEITASRQVAFCTALIHMTGTKVDGEKVDLWFRSTVGLRNAGARWEIAHVHESVPFYMDGSDRAALDLRP